jgi:hypothetical protein
MPARGWYPLSPHERFEPSYHVREDYLRRLNHDVHPDTHHRGEEHRGVTVVPQEQFGQRGRVPVAHVPHATVPPQVAQRAPGAAPPAPPPTARFHERDWRGEDRRGDNRGPQAPERFEHRGDGQGRNGGVQVLTAPSMPQGARPPEQRQMQVLTAPSMPPSARPVEQRAQQPMQAAPMPQPGEAVAVPAGQPAVPQWRDRRENVEEARRAMPERFERRRGELEFEQRRQQMAPAPVAAAQPVSQFPVPQPVVPHYQTMPAPAPVVPQIQPMQAPPPVVQQQRPVIPAAAQPAPAAAAGPAPRREEHHGGHRDDRRDDRRQQDR